MPHLLIAGATGTGKSVSINAMIMSILFKASPRDVRFDHDRPEDARAVGLRGHPAPAGAGGHRSRRRRCAALDNMVEEMEERYRLLHDKGVRNIDGYNRLVGAGGRGRCARRRSS